MGILISQKGHSVRRYVLTMVLVQDVMTCCTAHGVTTTIKYRDMAAEDCEVPSEILLSSKIYKRGLDHIILMTAHSEDMVAGLDFFCFLFFCIRVFFRSY